MPPEFIFERCLMKTQSKVNLKIMRRPTVETITGLSRSSIYEKMDNGTFPKPIRLSERSVGWLEHEIQEWLKNRVSVTREGGVQ